MDNNYNQHYQPYYPPLPEQPGAPPPLPARPQATPVGPTVQLPGNQYQNSQSHQRGPSQPAQAPFRRRPVPPPWQPEGEQQPPALPQRPDHSYGYDSGHSFNQDRPYNTPQSIEHGGPPLGSQYDRPDLAGIEKSQAYQGSQSQQWQPQNYTDTQATRHHHSTASRAQEPWSAPPEVQYDQLRGYGHAQASVASAPEHSWTGQTHGSRYSAQDPYGGRGQAESDTNNATYREPYTRPPMPLPPTAQDEADRMNQTPPHRDARNAGFSDPMYDNASRTRVYDEGALEAARLESERKHRELVAQYTRPNEPREYASGIEPRDYTAGIEPRDYTSRVEPRNYAGTEPRDFTSGIESRDYTAGIEPRVGANPDHSSTADTHTPPSAITSQLDSLTTSVQGLNLADPAAQTTVRATQVSTKSDEPDDWVRPRMQVNETGDQNSVIWDCPGNRTLPYQRSWYHLPDLTDFLICTRCHDRFIKGTNIATSFVEARFPTGKCLFNVPRVTRIILPRCVAATSTQPLRDYATRRLQIPNCAGQAAFKRTADTKVFLIKRATELASTMSGFGACEACYEDIVADSPYAPEFASSTGPPPATEASWRCDFSFPYVERLFLDSARRGTPFVEWAAAAARRFEIPSCENKLVEASSREWFRTREHVKDMSICEACYLDNIALTAIKADFEHIPIAKPVRGSEWLDNALGYRSEQPTAWICHNLYFPIRGALAHAIKRKDAPSFVRAASAIIPYPICGNGAITKGTWYTLRGSGPSSPKYNLCLSCYTAFIDLPGFAPRFEPSPLSGTEDAIVCSLSDSAPRCQQFADKLDEAMETGPWEVFPAEVRMWVDVPVCARSKHVDDGRRWWGYQDCLVCEECWISFCKQHSTSLLPSFEVRGEPIANRMCCLYSPRMRQLWLSAEAQGSPAELLTFSQRRHGVYARTVPQVEMLRAMQKMQMESAMASGMAGVLYQGANSISAISGATDGFWHGSGSLGWYETQAGAQGAQAFQDMQAGMSAANAPGGWMQIFQLQRMWEEVE